MSSGSGQVHFIISTDVYAQQLMKFFSYTVHQRTNEQSKKKPKLLSGRFAASFYTGKSTTESTKGLERRLVTHIIAKSKIPGRRSAVSTIGFALFYLVYFKGIFSTEEPLLRTLCGE